MFFAAGEFPIRAVNQAEFLERIAAKRDAGVAGDTAVIHKRFQAFALLFVERADVAFEVIVPTGGREQGALESGNGMGDVVKRDLAFFIAIHVFKHFLIFRNMGDFGHHGFFARHGHFHRIEQRAAGLLFHVNCAAIPELAAEQGGVERGGGIAAAKQAFITLAGGHIVHAVAGEVVAGIAAHGVAAREARLIP